MTARRGHCECYEAVGELYYRATGRLRPGKSEPLGTGRDSNDQENRDRFDHSRPYLH